MNQKQIVYHLMDKLNFKDGIKSSAIRTNYIELCFKTNLKPCSERNLRYCINHYIKEKGLKSNIKCINGLKEKIIFKE